ncbi:MAG: zinc ribbon domain-containing protein [Atopobiaceae bacterium]|nr:zinc ribbon domain-containing protein [Atopobiaceae bacterium]
MPLLDRGERSHCARDDGRRGDAEERDLPAEPACQCCGTSFSVPHMERGADADGIENPAYCKWCYDQGTFAYETMDDVIETSAPYLMEATGMSLDEAVSFMGALLPTLDHWRREDNDRS